MLQKIAQQQKKRLGCLGANLKKPGYINEMKSMISELMQYQISPEGIDTLMECAGSSRCCTGNFRMSKLFTGSFLII